MLNLENLTPKEQWGIILLLIFMSGLTEEEKEQLAKKIMEEIKEGGEDIDQL